MVKRLFVLAAAACVLAAAGCAKPKTEVALRNRAGVEQMVLEYSFKGVRIGDANIGDIDYGDTSAYVETGSTGEVDITLWRRSTQNGEQAGPPITSAPGNDEIYARG